MPLCLLWWGERDRGSQRDRGRGEASGIDCQGDRATHTHTHTHTRARAQAHTRSSRHLARGERGTTSTVEQSPSRNQDKNTRTESGSSRIRGSCVARPWINDRACLRLPRPWISGRVGGLGLDAGFVVVVAGISRMLFSAITYPECADHGITVN